MFSSNWFVTLTATLIGVFLALYMNEKAYLSKLDRQKAIATNNILSEIDENKNIVEDQIDNLQVLLGMFQFLNRHMNEDDQLIVEMDSMRIFRTMYPNTFTVEDSTLLENGKFHYRGKVSGSFGMSVLNLTNLSWETLRSSGLASSYDFDCLLFLERVDRLMNECLTQEKVLLDLLRNQDQYEEESFQERMEFELRTLIEYETGLLDSYKHSQEVLGDCE